MENFSLYFILFIIYSFIGWSIEVSLYLISEKRFINRGFLIGPYCPIYGSAAIIMILYLNQYKDNIITTFLLAIIICSIIEYLISYIMEKLFNARWWDYTNYKYNVNGRICLKNSFLFGLLGILLIYIVNPFLSGLLNKINSKVLIIIAITLLIIFISDFIFSMIITYQLKNSIKKVKKDNTEEFSKKIKATLETKFFNKRIFKAYPKYKINILKLNKNNDNINKKG